MQTILCCDEGNLAEVGPAQVFQKIDFVRSLGKNKKLQFPINGQSKMAKTLVDQEIKHPAYALDSTQVKTYALDSTCFYM